MTRTAALAFARLLVASWLGMLSWTATLPAGERDEIIENTVVRLGRESNQVMGHLDYLTNRIGARLTGSQGDHLACEWVRQQLESYGLQNVRMEEAGEFPVGFERGPWKGRMVAPVEMALEFGTPAWTAGTRGTVRGPARLLPADPSSADPSAYRGAWILMTRSPNRRDEAAQKLRREQTAFLESANVAGFLYATRGEYVVTFGNPRLSWDRLPTTPRVQLIQPQWEEINRRLQGGEEVVLEFDIRNRFVPGPVKYYNVIADLIGTEFPDEYVILGGHIDSWDGATGTTDNAIGVAVNLEAARLLTAAGARPRRTIRFAFWSGEEQGLLGSQAYIRQYESTMTKTSGVFVWDGGTNVVVGIPASEAMYEDMQRAFAAVNAVNPEYPFVIQRDKGLPVGIGSDQDSFLRVNVPGFFWSQEGRVDYRHGMHTQFDTFDLAVPEYLEHSATVVALGGLGVANLDGLLSRENLRAPRAPEGRRMGVFLDDLTIEDVTPDSVAARAGLLAGDVFQSVDGQPVAGRPELVQAISAGAPRKTVVVLRDGKNVELILEWPQEPVKPAREAF
ncbi:MAG: M20/M25/M40 family metallo-hydrolase [Planctomycetota bacterium]